MCIYFCATPLFVKVRLTAHFARSGHKLKALLCTCSCRPMSNMKYISGVGFDAHHPHILVDDHTSEVISLLFVYRQVHQFNDVQLWRWILALVLG